CRKSCGLTAYTYPFITKQFQLHGFSLGWVVAIFELGCMAGTLGIAWFANRYGRKNTMIFIALLLVITSIGVALAPNATMLCLWRFIQGASVGAASVVSPMYIAEIAPAHARGKLVSLNQLTIILGILTATVSAYCFGNANNADSWRWMFGSALIPALVFFAGVFLIPETPRWLVKANRDTEAHKVLTKIGEGNFIEKEMSDIKKSLTQHIGKKGSYRDLLGATVFPALMVGFGIAILQQFCGVNNVTQYVQVIFEKAHINLSDGLFKGMFVGLVFFVFTFLAIILVDKIGRKILMLTGTALMAFFLFMLAWSFQSDSVDGRLVFLFVMGYIGTFAFTLGPVVWVLLSEIYPNYIREKALSLSSCMLWTATFVVVLVSPYLLDSSPAFNFLLFAVLNVVGFVFIWYFLPETKGRTLEDMEEVWKKKAKSK
ncbi:MAG: sugar porter family MFS transporter, partial [Bacteroidia bacterium]|nr:sugar porter family MFS transporter [Bacteroidia bacterium]